MRHLSTLVTAVNALNISRHPNLPATSELYQDLTEPPSSINSAANTGNCPKCSDDELEDVMIAARYGTKVLVRVCTRRCGSRF